MNGIGRTIVALLLCWVREEVFYCHADDDLDVDWRITTIDDGYAFSLTVLEGAEDDSASSDCEVGTDNGIFGKTECSWESGETIVALLEATVPSPGLTEDATITGDFSIDVDFAIVTIGWDFECQVCGTTCDISISWDLLGITEDFEVEMPDCPIVGNYTEIVQWVFPEGLFSGFSGSIEGDLVIRDDDGGRVLRLEINAEFDS